MLKEVFSFPKYLQIRVRLKKFAGYSHIRDAALFQLLEKGLMTEESGFLFLFGNFVRTPARTIMRESILWRT